MGVFFMQESLRRADRVVRPYRMQQNQEHGPTASAPVGAKCPERISRSGHLLFALHSAKHQLAVFRIDGNCRTGLDAALQNLLCKQRFHRMLHMPAQRTRAELRIVGRVDDELFCSLRQLTTQLLVGQTAVERRDLQVDDTSALRPFPDRSSAVRFQSRG